MSRVFFSILKFWFSRLSGGWKGKKWPKTTKISVCGTLYFSNHISYDLHIWYPCMYKRIISLGIFFHFFQNFVFRDHQVGEVKGQKNGPKWQKFCVSLCISGTTHYMIVIWVHMYKMTISPANFFIFQNFDFWGF